MAIRPSDHWRARVEEERREITSGTLSPDDAFMEALFPASLIERTDATLAAFEADLAALHQPGDELVFDLIERTVCALNAVNKDHGGVGYETGEREQLCAYIDKSLTEAGIDLDALASRRRIGRNAITDEWRLW